MIINHADPEEFVQFWKFWFWQYTSRNPEYRAAYSQFTNPKRWRGIIKAASNHFGYNFCEKTLKILWDATEGVPGAVEKFMDLFKIEDPWQAQVKINQFAPKTERLRVLKRKQFEDKFLCSPKNPAEDNDSVKILQDALNGNLNKDIPNFKTKTFEEDIIHTIEPTQFTYLVDTEIKPLEQVLAEITYWYRVHEYPVSPDKRSKASVQHVARFTDQRG